MNERVQVNLKGERNPLKKMREKKMEKEECMVEDCSRDQEADWHNLCERHRKSSTSYDPSHPICPNCGFDPSDEGNDHEPWAGDICPECDSDLVVKGEYCMVCGRPIDAGFPGHISDGGNFLIGSPCYVALLRGDKPEYWSEDMERVLR